MGKIGILSLYHDSINYGGVLQAYALCKFLDGMGYESEQMDVDWSAKCKSLSGRFYFAKTVFRSIKPVFYVFDNIRHWKERKLRKELRDIFCTFKNGFIPHSAEKYNDRNISKSVLNYDIFIVGSDQMWNPRWYSELFFLSFVSSDKPKIAYAVSISQKTLSQKVKKIYKEHIKDFMAISVRERDAVELLTGIAPQNVEYVLDPVLLLSADDWDIVISDRVVTKPYVFCYFLGDDKNMRNIASDYARKNNILLVNIKHASGRYHKADLKYGAIKIEAPTPNEFLSLIKYADTVFTDSFHATAFSLLFKKQFYTFERLGLKEMGTRIKSLTELFEVENRFCNTKDRQTIDYVNEQKDIDYTVSFEFYEIMKEKSINFLKDSLLKAAKRAVRNEGQST